MNDPTIEIRLLDEDDWQVWRDLRLRSLADTPDAFGSTLAREQAFTEETWRQRAAGGAVVGSVDGVPAALGSSFQPRPGWSHIVAMWTAPEFRRLGLARLVLDQLVEQAKAKGHRVVLDVARGNDAARTAYEHYGFVATGCSEPVREGSTIHCDEMVLPE